MLFEPNLYFSFTALISVNIVIYLCVKHIWQKRLDNSMMTLTIDSYTDNLNYFKSFWEVTRIVNISIWIVIIVVAMAFHSGNKYDEPENTVSNKVLEEIKTVEIPTNEIIDDINTTSLKEKELIRESEIETEREKSRSSFNDFLESAN